MAGNQPARKDAGAFDSKEWMAQRQADVQRLLQGAEAEGRKLWVESTRTGRNLSAPNPRDVAALGMQKPSAAQRHGGPPNPVRAGETGWLHDPRAKALGGLAALGLGEAAGVARAGLHTAEGVGDGVGVVGRILNPIDRALSPPAQRPAQQLMRAASNAVDTGFNALAHPAGQLRKWNQGLNPFGTPQADTFAGELSRNFRIGMNQGEVGADAAALAFGSGVLKVVPRLAPISKAAEMERFVKQGLDPEVAEYLAKPYEGQGHHAVFPSRFKFPETFLNVPLPKALAGQPLPSELSNSRLNVLKPNNISQGGFYELHHDVDSKMTVARLPKRFGGAWNGKSLGLQKLGLLGRIWHGTPAELNAVVGSGAAAGLEADAQANGDNQGEGQE